MAPTLFLLVSCLRSGRSLRLQLFSSIDSSYNSLQGRRRSFTQIYWNAIVGGAVASWSVRSFQCARFERSESSGPVSSPGDIVLCSWARHLTLTVPLSTHVFK